MSNREWVPYMTSGSGPTAEGWYETTITDGRMKGGTERHVRTIFFDQVFGWELPTGHVVVAWRDVAEPYRGPQIKITIDTRPIEIPITVNGTAMTTDRPKGKACEVIAEVGRLIPLGKDDCWLHVHKPDGQYQHTYYGDQMFDFQPHMRIEIDGLPL